MVDLMVRRSNPRSVYKGEKPRFEPWGRENWDVLELSDAQVKVFEKRYRRMQVELAKAMDVPLAALVNEFGLDFDPVVLARLFLDEKVAI